MTRFSAQLAVLIFAIPGVLLAQEKAAAKGAKSASTPKPLIFDPAVKMPDANSGPRYLAGADGLRAVGSNDPILEGPGQVVTTFFAALKEGKIDDGYATLTKGSKIAEKPEELRQLKTKTREAIDVFGNIHGFDFVESRAIGQRLVRATYVSLGKVFPLRWRFYFYKTEDAWRLIDMRVDDKLTGIFEEGEEPRSDEPTVP